MSDAKADFQRLDFWLWCARFARGRSDCVGLVEGGGIRINRQPTDKPHAKVRIGDVITLPVRDDVLVLRVLGLAARRGPAAQARALYDLLSPGAPCTEGETPAYAPDREPGPGAATGSMR